MNNTMKNTICQNKKYATLKLPNMKIRVGFLRKDSSLLPQNQISRVIDFYFHVIDYVEDLENN